MKGSRQRKREEDKVNERDGEEKRERNDKRKK